MNDNVPSTGSTPGKVGSCAECEIAFILGVISGCYVAGFGYSGWLAIAVGLHVWVTAGLVLKHWGPAIRRWLGRGGGA